MRASVFEYMASSAPWNVPLTRCSQVVHVDADNTMAISAWAMGTAGDAASPADGAAASPQPALPQIPPERRRSGSRLRNSSGGSELLAPIAEGACCRQSRIPIQIAGEGLPVHS